MSAAEIHDARLHMPFTYLDSIFKEKTSKMAFQSSHRYKKGKSVALLLIAFSQFVQSNAQTPAPLHESVPYQNHPLISAPVSIEELQDNGTEIWWMQCEQDTFLTMMADLRQLLSTATSPPPSIVEPCNVQSNDGRCIGIVIVSR